jgi:hypothetical protein
MKKIGISLHFNSSGYIGLPYWPERNTIINVNKDIHPKLGDVKKKQALEAALEKRGLTLDDYKHMETLAERPFYTIDDTRDAEIIIPQRVIQSFLNNASMNAPKAIPKITEKGLTFIGVKLDPPYLTTGKTVKDSKRFERFVKMAESNQRSFCSSLFIDNFMAKGHLVIDEDIIKQEDLMKLFEYGGKYIGIGSARPQGFGRFRVESWELLQS